ncbi:hypothetical protein GQ42DRAFT_173164 [Ramicandelaber brevisporus]|nr:hypothetical protein GQ42DRAFT_173164 [Ramicandelaber brevisporus]
MDESVDMFSYGNVTLGEGGRLIVSVDSWYLLMHNLRLAVESIALVFFITNLYAIIKLIRINHNSSQNTADVILISSLPTSRSNDIGSNSSTRSGKEIESAIGYLQDKTGGIRPLPMKKRRSIFKRETSSFVSSSSSTAQGASASNSLSPSAAAAATARTACSPAATCSIMYKCLHYVKSIQLAYFLGILHSCCGLLVALSYIVHTFTVDADCATDARISTVCYSLGTTCVLISYAHQVYNLTARRSSLLLAFVSTVIPARIGFTIFAIAKMTPVMKPLCDIEFDALGPVLVMAVDVVLFLTLAVVFALFIADARAAISRHETAHHWSWAWTRGGCVMLLIGTVLGAVINLFGIVLTFTMKRGTDEIEPEFWYFPAWSLVFPITAKLLVKGLEMAGKPSKPAGDTRQHSRINEPAYPRSNPSNHQLPIQSSIAQYQQQQQQQQQQWQQQNRSIEAVSSPQQIHQPLLTSPIQAHLYQYHQSSLSNNEESIEDITPPTTYSHSFEPAPLDHLVLSPKHDHLDGSPQTALHHSIGHTSTLAPSAAPSAPSAAPVLPASVDNYENRHLSAMGMDVGDLNLIINNNNNHGNYGDDHHHTVHPPISPPMFVPLSISFLDHLATTTTASASTMTSATGSDATTATTSEANVVSVSVTAARSTGPIANRSSMKRSMSTNSKKNSF